MKKETGSLTISAGYLKSLETENAELKQQLQEMTDNHQEKCAQIAQYDNEIEMFRKIIRITEELLKEYQDKLREVKNNEK